MKFSAFFLFSLITYSIVLCEHKSNKKQKLKYELAVLGYVRGYKTGDDTVLKYPAFLVSPVVFVPMSNSNENGNTQINTKENNTSSTLTEILQKDNANQYENSDIKVNFREALDRGDGNKKDLEHTKIIQTNEEINDSMKGGNTVSENETTTIKTIKTEQNVTKESMIERFIATESTVNNPNEIFNKEVMNTVTEAIKEPDRVLYPPLEDQHWKNFTVSTNNIILKESNTKPLTSDLLNITGYPSVNDTDSLIKGVYPTSLYNNAEIDQLSITTNSYTNESPLPPPQDDRWRSFSSLGKMLPKSNQFRPLAGLYYDGFLHRPILKSPDFVPYSH